jgi:hypothetical protein
MRVQLAFLACALLAACGDDGSNHQQHLDGGGSDGSANIQDAGPDAAPQPVAVTLTSGGSAVGSAQVWFLNADNSVVSSTTTDDTGTASAVMVAGGSVTVVAPEELPALRAKPTLPQGVSRLYTFTAVKPGDHLHVDADPLSPDTQQVAVTVPLVSTVAATPTYTMYSTCDADVGDGTQLEIGSGIATGTMTLVASCTVADFSVWAVGSGIDQYATASAIPIAASINFGTNLTAYSNPVSESFAFSDAAALSDLSVMQALVTAHGLLVDPDGSDAAPSGSSASFTMDEAFFATAKELTDVQATSSATVYGQDELIELAAQGSSYSLDVGSNLLHFYASQPTYDVGTRTLTWTESSGGIDPNVQNVEIEIDGTSGEVDWYLTAPRAGTTVQFPQLPATPVDYNVTEDDTITVRGLESASIPGGYDLVRGHAFTILDGNGFDPTQLSTLLLANGKVAIERLHSPEVLARASHPHRAPAHGAGLHP